MKSTTLGFISSAAMTFGLASEAQANHILPAIEPGNIAVLLNPVATGLAAPDYAINAPGDTSRLFVVEQNGLLRVIQNGSLLPDPALDIRALVAPPLVPTNANDPNVARLNSMEKTPRRIQQQGAYPACASKTRDKPPFFSGFGGRSVPSKRRCPLEGAESAR